MIICKAKIADAGELEKVSRIVHQEFSHWSFENKKKFTKTLSDRYKGIYIAQLDNRIIAYLHYEYVKEKRRLWIEQLYVLKEYRKKGIAEILMKKAIDKFKKIKHISIVLLTADRNLEVFDKLGFKKTMNYLEFK